MIRVCLSAALLAAAWSVPAVAQGNDLGSAQAEALPPDFRGKVQYFGNHSGEVRSVRTIRGGPRKDCPRPDQGCPERVGGSLEVELEYDGDIVKGSFRGTGGLRESALIGRRVGSQCRLYDLTDGSVWSGRCDGESFLGSVKSVPNAAVQIAISFEAVGTRVRDFSEWQRRRREAILRKRRYEILQAQLAGNGPIETRFAAAIELDSFNWYFDRLRPNTIRNITKTKPKRGFYQVSGEFSLESGAAGWARANIENEVIACVEYWDVPGVCRPLSATPPPPEPENEPPADADAAWLLPREALPADAQPTNVAFRLLSDQ